MTAKCLRGVWCDAMRESLNPLNSEGKGLSVMFGWPDGAPEGSRPVLLGITYRPKAKAQGFVLNVCPWCEAKIKFWPDETPQTV